MYNVWVPWLHSASCEVHVGSVCVSHLGSSSSAPPWPREVGGRDSRHQKLPRLEKPWTPGQLPLSLSRSGYRVPPAPSDLLLAAKPNRSGRVGGSRNLPGHFCAKGGLWQAERRAKRARQKGGLGLRAALGTSAPPRPRLESQETKSRTRGLVGEGLSGSETWTRALLHGGGIWAGLPSWVQLQIRVWM